MAQWLEQSLADSPARWKIVMGHHPIWSSAGSKFQQARMMRAADPARALPPCRPVPRRPRAHARAAYGRLQGRAGGAGPPAAAAARLRGRRQAAPAEHELRAAPARRESGADEPLGARPRLGLRACDTGRRIEATIRMVTTPDDGSGAPSRRSSTPSSGGADSDHDRQARTTRAITSTASRVAGNSGRIRARLQPRARRRDDRGRARLRRRNPARDRLGARRAARMVRRRRRCGARASCSGSAS